MTFYLILQMIVAILAIIGGGYSIYQIINGITRRLVIKSNIGVYGIQSISGLGNKLFVSTKINFLNSKNETITITDIVGSIKYKTGERFTEKTNSREDIFPIVIKSKEAKQSDLDFIFEDVNLDTIVRDSIFHFKGFMEGDPVFLIDEKENEISQDKPIRFHLSFHINNDTVETHCVSLIKNTVENRKKMKGTFTDLDIKRIEQNI